MSKFDYFEMCSGMHSFFTGYFLFVIDTLKEMGAKVDFHTCLEKPLKDIEAFVSSHKGQRIDKIHRDLPAGGFYYGVSDSNEYKPTLEHRYYDYSYEFKGLTKDPVYVSSINYVSVDYGDASYTIICAADKGQATQFMDTYFRFRRELNRNAVMNYRGNKIPYFRRMNWNEIFLPNNMLEDIRNDVDGFFGSKDLYKKHGIDWRLGLLFAGPPGNGKTAVCRAIATTAEVPVVYCALDDDMYTVMTHLQATISAHAPCIVIIEDADTLGADKAVRSNFLNMLDGLFSTEGVLTLASTNNPEDLDPAFTGRPSRFDSLYVFKNPPMEQRKNIFLRKLESVAPQIKDDQVDTLVREMDDLSAACVQEVAVKAMRAAFRSKSSITLELLAESLEKVKKHMTMSDEGIDKVTRGSVGFSPQSSRHRFDFDFDDDAY